MNWNLNRLFEIAGLGLLARGGVRAALLLISPLLAIILSACITVVVAPTPPAGLPALTAPATRSESLPGTCVSYKEAQTRVGETLCVRGFVSSATQSGSTFFINFDTSRDSFYAVSFRHTWSNLRNKCVEIVGRVSEFRGRAQIIIEHQDQLTFCK